MSFDRARRIADAVLYEGYLLYPYRASAGKNQVRWQFGVLAPRGWCEAGGCESWWSQTDCLVEAAPGAPVTLRCLLRFLQLQRRAVETCQAGGFGEVPALEVAGERWTSWDEAVEREAELRAPLAAGASRALDLPAGSEEERLPASGAAVGRLVRRRWPLHGSLRVSSERVDERLLLVRIRVENSTPWADPAAPRDEALRSSLLGTHLLLGVEGGAFLSATDPPEWARTAAARCASVRTWPVLVAGEPGEGDAMLSSPIILGDHPAVAEESPGDLFDGTEIDEILTLRTLALTDEEKAEARATDARAAAIIDRVEGLGAEALARLHGTLRPAGGEPTPPPPWWSPEAEAAISPETESVQVGGVAVARGSLVRLRPGAHADAQDMFLAGRLATVEGVYVDLEERRHVAVTLPGAPAAGGPGRYLYFSPDEIEPAGGAP